MVLTKAWADRWARTVTSVPETRDFEAYEKLFDPRVMWRSPLIECIGARAVRQRFEDLLVAVPDYHCSVQPAVVDVVADRAVFEVVMSGTVVRDLAGSVATVEASGQPFLLHSVMVVDFDRAGIVTEVRMYFDTAEARGEGGTDRIAI